MKIRLGMVFLGIAACLHADPVTVSFEAKVVQIQDPKGIASPLLKPGATISGKYTFDPATRNSSTWTGLGDYDHAESPYGFTVNVDNHLIMTKPGGAFFIEVQDDYNEIDALNFISYENQTDDPLTPAGSIAWQMVDPQRKALDSADLPKGIPPWKRFAKDQQVLDICFGELNVGAQVTRMNLGDSLFHPKIRIMPPAGDFLVTQQLNPVVRIDGEKSKPATIQKLFLNGVDVTHEYLPKATSGHLVGESSGVIWNLGGLKTLSGPQEFKVKVRFASGASGWAAANWNVIPASLDQGNGRIEQKAKFKHRFPSIIPARSASTVP